MDRLIYDRTEADVEYAKANQSSGRFLKGAYNYKDLNRIEEWCEYLQTELGNSGYITSLSIKTTWSESDFPTQAELERIRNNINTLKELYYSTTNVPSDINKMTYKKANDLEKVLDEINNTMVNMRNWYVYGGVARGGQPRLWQHRFRQFYSGVTYDELLTTETGDILTTESGEELEADII